MRKTFFAFALMLASPAHAGDSANKMLPACQNWLSLGSGDTTFLRNMAAGDPYRLVSAGECGGAVLAIADTLQRLQLICPPTELTRGQIVRVVASDLAKHPEQWQGEFSTLAAEVLEGVWPCRDEPPLTVLATRRDEAFLIAVNIAKLPSAPRQILKDIPRPPNSANRDD